MEAKDCKGKIIVVGSLISFTASFNTTYGVVQSIYESSDNGALMLYVEIQNTGKNNTKTVVEPSKCAVQKKR